MKQNIFLFHKFWYICAMMHAKSRALWPTAVYRSIDGTFVANHNARYAIVGHWGMLRVNLKKTDWRVVWVPLFALVESYFVADASLNIMVNNTFSESGWFFLTLAVKRTLSSTSKQEFLSSRKKATYYMSSPGYCDLQRRRNNGPAK